MLSRTVVCLVMWLSLVTEALAIPKIPPGSTEGAVYWLLYGDNDVIVLTPQGGRRDHLTAIRGKEVLARIVRGERPYTWLPMDADGFLRDRGRALWWIPQVDPSLALTLVREIFDREPQLRLMCLYVLGGCADLPGAGELLVQGLEDAIRRGSGDECEAALRSLGQIKYRPAIPTVKKCLDLPERYWALRVLGELGGPELIPTLRKHLVRYRDSLSDVRLAVEALGKVGTPELLSELEPYAGHSDGRVRELAKEAVRAIRKRAGLPPPEPPKGSLGFQPLKTLPAGATALLEPATGVPR